MRSPDFEGLYGRMWKVATPSVLRNPDRRLHSENQRHTVETGTWRGLADPPPVPRFDPVWHGLTRFSLLKMTQE